MKKFQSIFGIDNSWFYTEMPWWGKMSLIYIRGDLFVLQQFGDKKYRPYDFGFKNLDNNAIYILYQTFAIVGIVGGLTLVY